MIISLQTKLMNALNENISNQDSKREVKEFKNYNENLSSYDADQALNENIVSEDETFDELKIFDENSYTINRDIDSESTICTESENEDLKYKNRIEHDQKNAMPTKAETEYETEEEKMKSKRRKIFLMKMKKELTLRTNMNLRTKTK